MLKSEATKILRTIERRLRPARPPWHGDDAVLEDWADLLTRYEAETVATAFNGYRDGGNDKWPNYYTFRELLKVTRSRAAHPAFTPGSCDNCSGTGWQAGNDITIINRTYARVEPCACPAGQLAERTELWTQAPGLCQACKGAGWFNHEPDNVERCDNCNGSGIARP